MLKHNVSRLMELQSLMIFELFFYLWLIKIPLEFLFAFKDLVCVGKCSKCASWGKKLLFNIQNLKCILPSI